MKKPAKKWIILFVLIVVLSVMPLSGFIGSDADNLQRVSITLNLLFIGILVAVTAFYAEKTSEIADETRKQALATLKSAESSSQAVIEMREQRYLASQPWIFPSVEGEHVGTIPLSFANVGNGTAIAVRPIISDGRAADIPDTWKRTGWPGNNVRIGPRWLALQHGDTITWPQAFEVPRNGESGAIVVEYRDIYGREFLSGCEYRIAKIEEDRVALIAGAPIYPVERPRAEKHGEGEDVFG